MSLLLPALRDLVPKELDARTTNSYGTQTLSFPKEPRKLDAVDEKLPSLRGAKRAELIKSGRLGIDQALASGLDKIYQRLNAVFQYPAAGDFIRMLVSEQSLPITGSCDWGDCHKPPYVWRFDRKRNWLPCCHTCCAIPDPDGHSFTPTRNYREPREED